MVLLSAGLPDYCLGDRQVKAYPRTRLYLPNQAEKDCIRDRSREAGKPEGIAEQ